MAQRGKRLYEKWDVAVHVHALHKWSTQKDQLSAKVQSLRTHPQLLTKQMLLHENDMAGGYTVADVGTALASVAAYRHCTCINTGVDGCTWYTMHQPHQTAV
jgi:hypothetical protein